MARVEIVERRDGHARTTRDGQYERAKALAGSAEGPRERDVV